MATLEIIVPNGENCDRCPYLTKQSKETGYNQWSDTTKCVIFNKNINYQKKCDECYLRTNKK